jgi:hypothetical protein
VKRAAPDERPTLIPSFDVPKLARDSDRWDHAPQSESGERPALAIDAAEGGSVYARAADVYWSQLGGPDAVPVLLVPLRDVRPDQRGRCEGFLLCRIDGKSTVAEIIEQSGLPELTALSLACDLLSSGIIAVFAARSA